MSFTLRVLIGLVVGLAIGPDLAFRGARGSSYTEGGTTSHPDRGSVVPQVDAGQIQALPRPQFDRLGVDGAHTHLRAREIGHDGDTASSVALGGIIHPRFRNGRDTVPAQLLHRVVD